MIRVGRFPRMGILWWLFYFGAASFLFSTAAESTSCQASCADDTAWKIVKAGSMSRGDHALHPEERLPKDIHSELLENGTHEIVYETDGSMISGPLFEGTQITQLATTLFEVIYDITANKFGVFIATNNAEKEFTLISVGDPTRRTGIDVFPAYFGKLKREAAVVYPKKTRSFGYTTAAFLFPRNTPGARTSEYSRLRLILYDGEPTVTIRLRENRASRLF